MMTSCETKAGAQVQVNLWRVALTKNSRGNGWLAPARCDGSRAGCKEQGAAAATHCADPPSCWISQKKKRQHKKGQPSTAEEAATRLKCRSVLVRTSLRSLPTWLDPTPLLPVWYSIQRNSCFPSSTLSNPLSVYHLHCPSVRPYPHQHYENLNFSTQQRQRDPAGNRDHRPVAHDFFGRRHRYSQPILINADPFPYIPFFIIFHNFRCKTSLNIQVSLAYASTGLSLTHFRNMDQRSAEDSEDAFSAALGSSLRGSATSDAVTNNRCCDRQPRKHFVGYGASLVYRLLFPHRKKLGRQKLEN